MPASEAAAPAAGTVYQANSPATFKLGEYDDSPFQL